jgi:hypothetical protein
MAEKTKKPGFFSRYVGGLLGEDVESMTPEERRRANLSVLGIIARGMGSPEAGSEALALTRASRAAERESAGLARRQAAAEALMPQVVGRLFGGSAGRLESLPGGEGGELTSRYRQDPRSATAALYGSQAGRDLSQMAPDLAKLATEGTLGRTVGGSVYNPLTGGFTAPPQQAGTTTLSPDEVRQLGAPAGTIIQRDSSGKLSVLPVSRAVAGGAAPRAAVGGGTPVAPGGAPGAAPAPGVGRLGNLLTAEELRAAKLPEGTVAQFNPKTGQINTLSQVPPAERTALGAKEIAVSRTESAGELLQEQLEKVSGGGPIGIRGAAARVFDSQDAALFETFKQQFSTALRAALRLPGEGPMSDRDAAQAGLTLPSLSFSKERNIQIIRALEDQVRLVAKLPTLKEEKPEGISTSDWLMMLPSERDAFKRAGAK